MGFKDTRESEQIQQVFNEQGPEPERKLCDWWRCTESPWRELADIFVFGRR